MMLSNLQVVLWQAQLRLLNFQETNKLLPLVEVTSDNTGSFLYSDPPDKSFTLFAGPDADVEVVVYSNLSHSVERYDNFSGTSCNETWNVVVPTPEIV